MTGHTGEFDEVLLLEDNRSTADRFEHVGGGAFGVPPCHFAVGMRVAAHPPHSSVRAR